MRLPALLLVACTAPTAAPEPAPAPRAEPRRIVGHVGLHQFQSASHAWANFVAEPIAIERYVGDDPFGVEPRAARSVGGCALHVLGALSPPTPRWIDVGEVVVSGGAQPLRMWFGPHGYLTDPAPGSARLFHGGESLEIEGKTFRTRITAPSLPAIVALELPRSVQWKSELSPAMTIVLTASPRDGRPSAYIRCATSDVGALTFPETLVSALPAPPRDLRLDVERYEERLAVTADGDAVVVRVAHTVWIRAAD